MTVDLEQPDAALDEMELVRGIVARRTESVDRFLARYRPVFHHCIAQFESDAAQREDLFQELFVTILERLDRESFDPAKGSLGTWVYRVAWCRCVDLKRKASARGHVRPIGIVDEELPEQADTESDPGRTVGDQEIGSMVRAALAELSGEDRRLLELRYLKSKTIGDVSRELGITLETAKYRLKRASGHLRGRLLRDPLHREVEE